MKILVTGAAGFIGAALSRRLLQSGSDVVGVDNFSPYYSPKLKEDRVRDLLTYQNFSLHRLDLTDEEWTRAVGSNFEVVVHLAAQPGVRYSLENPRAYVKSNIDGFLNVLEYCRSMSPRPYLLYASSSSVYGDSDHFPYRENQNTDHPLSFYAATKKANEVMAHSYGHLFKIPMTGLRFFTVYGPWGRPDMAVMSFTRNLLTGHPIHLYDQGTLRRDFTYIEDVTECLVRLIKQGPPNKTSSLEPRYEILNVGNSSPELVSNLVTALENLTHRKANLQSSQMVAGDVRETFSDTSLILQRIGYAPSTPLELGLKSFYDWYTSYYKK